MKPSSLLLLLLMFAGSASFSQITYIRPGQQATSGSQSFSVNFEKIVQAYRTNFHSIQGEAVPSEKEKVVFKSTMTLPGTLHAQIYRFHSKQDTSASWFAVMYTGPDQKTAIKTYRSVCRQVNKMRIGGLGIFKGDYDEPDANLRFAGSSYKLETEDKLYKNFFAEVDLVMNSDEEWEVHLSLVRKKDDDSMF